jgi:hypothetical protein
MLLLAPAPCTSAPPPDAALLGAPVLPDGATVELALDGTWPAAGATAAADDEPDEALDATTGLNTTVFEAMDETPPISIPPPSWLRWSFL